MCHGISRSLKLMPRSGNRTILPLLNIDETFALSPILPNDFCTRASSRQIVAGAQFQGQPCEVASSDLAAVRLDRYAHAP